MSKRVIVVGAGMAGLTAAGVMQSAGLHPVVLDKGRAVGGRMASRRVGDARFDHGAQHFSVRSPEFTDIVAGWKRDGIARVWFSAPSRTRPDHAVEGRHVGAGGMREIPEHLARNLDVRMAARVDRLEIEGRRIVAFSNGTPVADGAGAVVTPPLPQTLALLDASGIGLTAEVRRELDAVGYDACLAVLARLADPARLPDGHTAPAEGPIAWIADNQDKGTSPVPAATIHSTAEYAAAHLDEEPAQWTDDLTVAAAAHLRSPIVEALGHRWRYAMPRSPLDSGWVEADTPVPVLLGGEAFAGARIEGAFLSGLMVGREAIDRLR
jgi:predicted NAD/FAD-dependent oxidoreductase